MHHRSHFQAQNRTLPDELPRPPAKPPHEPLIIKIPPGGTLVPEPWPPRPPQERDIDEDDQLPWIPPEGDRQCRTIGRGWREPAHVVG